MAWWGLADSPPESASDSRASASEPCSSEAVLPPGSFALPPAHDSAIGRHEMHLIAVNLLGWLTDSLTHLRPKA